MMNTMCIQIEYEMCALLFLLEIPTNLVTLLSYLAELKWVLVSWFIEAACNTLLKPKRH